MKKIFCFLPACWILACSLILFGCSPAAPFSKNFNGVSGAYNESGDQIATLLFSGAEARAGEMNLKDNPASIYPFVYSISDKGDISFVFDQGVDATASGTLHGYELSVTVSVHQENYHFSGVFYAFTEMIDGDISEDGFLTAGYPLNDVITNAEPYDMIEMNGKKITYSELQNAKMPEMAVEIRINKAESSQN